MADVLVICIREEDKDDFIVEIIKGLISRGLTVSYTGAFFRERKGEYIYDSVTNLLFFASTYFRRTPMKSEDFITWEGFLDNIEFERIEERTVICVVTKEIRLEEPYDELKDFLWIYWGNMIVELVRNCFLMDFHTFEIHYPDFFEIFGLDYESFRELGNRMMMSAIRNELAWGNSNLDIFLEKCNKAKEEIEEKRRDNMEKKTGKKIEPTTERLQEIDRLQKKVELDCLKDPSKSKLLIEGFFGEETLKKASLDLERIMFINTKRRCPRRKILCLYLEEKGNMFNLYFYPEQPKKGNDEETGRPPHEETGRPPHEETGRPPPIPSLLKLQRSSMEFDSARKLYAPENIGKVIDEKVMLALHPPLVNTFFPTNNFMLEVDPEEPEIGFLSGKVDMRRHQSLGTILKIDNKLRKKLMIYRFKEKEKEIKFQKEDLDYVSEQQEENILIIGRIEDLYRIFVAKKRRGSLYQMACSWLKPLVILLVLITMTLGSFLINRESGLPLSIIVVGALFIVTFLFWTLRIFILEYLLEPIYIVLKWSTYFFLPIAVMLAESEYLKLVSTIFLFIPTFVAIILFADYIISAILYQLNNLLEIIGYDDTLEVEGLDNPKEIDILHMRYCGKFQIIVRKNNEKQVFFNSYIFPRIKCIKKKIRILPRKITYSSGIFYPTEEDKNQKEIQREKEGLIEKLFYKKPRAWGFWRNLKRLLFDKKEIEFKIGKDEKIPEDTRLIYFGEWNQVMKCIASAIPVSPQLVLFRNMIILGALSGLLFNILRIQMDKISLRSLVNWIGEIGPHNIIYYLIVPVAWFILVTGRLRFRFWKALIVLIFIYLLASQILLGKVLAIIIPIIFIFIILLRYLVPKTNSLRFLVSQAWFSFRIWVNERFNGNIVSVIEKTENIEGKRSQENLLLTKLSMRYPSGYEEERVYFKEKFWNDIVNSNTWEIKRENKKLQEKEKEEKSH